MQEEDIKYKYKSAVKVMVTLEHPKGVKEGTRRDGNIVMANPIMLSVIVYLICVVLSRVTPGLVVRFHSDLPDNP